MKKEAADITLFNEPVASGALHPVMATMDKIIEYFLALNFSLETGPLIEDDFHNFEALNLPKYHPARDMQDTFYLDDFRLLRTHTSPVQVDVTMLNQKPTYPHDSAQARSLAEYGLNAYTDVSPG